MNFESEKWDLQRIEPAEFPIKGWTICWIEITSKDATFWATSKLLGQNRV